MSYSSWCWYRASVANFNINFSPFPCMHGVAETACMGEMERN